MLNGNFPSGLRERRWKEREMERQWQCANIGGELEDGLLAIMMGTFAVLWRSFV
jgi:hypothetical protein